MYAHSFPLCKMPIRAWSSFYEAVSRASGRHSDQWPPVTDPTVRGHKDDIFSGLMTSTLSVVIINFPVGIRQIWLAYILFLLSSSWIRHFEIRTTCLEISKCYFVKSWPKQIQGLSSIPIFHIVMASVIAYAEQEICQLYVKPQGLIDKLFCDYHETICVNE